MLRQRKGDRHVTLIRSQRGRHFAAAARRHLYHSAGQGRAHPVGQGDRRRRERPLLGVDLRLHGDHTVKGGGGLNLISAVATSGRVEGGVCVLRGRDIPKWAGHDGREGGGGPGSEGGSELVECQGGRRERPAGARRRRDLGAA